MFAAGVFREYEVRWKSLDSCDPQAPARRDKRGSKRACNLVGIGSDLTYEPVHCCCVAAAANLSQTEHQLAA